MNQPASCICRLVAAMTLLAPTTASAWGPIGHQLVGGVADLTLNARANAQVAALIGMPLKLASNWADCAKDVRFTAGGAKYTPTPAYHRYCKTFETPAGIAEMEDYVNRNATNCDQSKNTEQCHKQYHYTDVAIEHDDYEPTFVGTSDHDIVAAIAAATLVLEGKPAPAPFSIKDKPEALLLLAHLVGDIHQPLHVGAVYLTPDGQLVDPDKATPFDPHTETRGGNDIHDGAQNLHAEWDAVTGTVTASHIKSLAKLASVPTSPGPLTRWSTAWASDTVEESHQAFAGLTFTAKPNRPGSWLVAFTDHPAYVAARKKLQDKQLATAGERLAQLLNGIWK